MGDRFDLVIVGGGPTGLFAAYYAGFRGLRVCVVDALPELGGQVSALYPEKVITDIAAFPAIKGKDLVSRLHEQASPFDPMYILGETVESSELLHDGSVVITTSTDRRVLCKAVILAAGIGSFSPRRLPAGEEFLGRGLAYFLPDLTVAADRDVVVVGGGDSACDWVLALAPIARSVTLVHRRAAFRAATSIVDAAKTAATRVVTDAEVTSARGGAWLTSVTLSVRDESALDVTLPCSLLVAALGFTADLGPLRHWGLAMEQRRVRVDSDMTTGVPAVFASGDITTYKGKVPLIAVGFGEAALAVNNAVAAISPGADLMPLHSTHT